MIIPRFSYIVLFYVLLFMNFNLNSCSPKYHHDVMTLVLDFLIILYSLVYTIKILIPI